MSNKILIPAEEYKNLLFQNLSQYQKIKEHQEEIKMIGEHVYKLEKFLLDSFYTRFEFQIEQLKLKDDQIDNTTYEYAKLAQEFIKLGFKDITYIDEMIIELYNRKEKR